MRRPSVALFAVGECCRILGGCLVSAGGGGFFQTIKAVAWSFFGVRRGKDHEADFSKLKPVYVIIAGIGMAAVFVISLVTLARFAVGQG